MSARTMRQIADEAVELEGRLRLMATTAWAENDGDDPSEPERIEAADVILDIADMAEDIVNRARSQA